MSTDKKTIDSYSDYAEKWAAHMRSGKNVAHEYLEKPAMYSKLPDLTGLDVLCIGCGTGEECAHLKSLGAKSVTGIDVSSGLIEYARKSYSELEFHVMDMEKLDFPDASFDFIYSSLVMHYVESWEVTLNSIKAVLKKGGNFLFSTHHPALYGGQRIRTEIGRVSLLGYRKNNMGKACEVVGDYFTARKIEDIWFGDFKVSYVHRSLQELMGDIIKSGMGIIDFAEPKPIPSCKEIDLVFWEIHEKIPLFIIFCLRNV